MNEHHGDAELCIISGDMVDRGTAVDYSAVGEMLRSLRMPFYPIVGNHDDRDLFRAHLPVPNDSMANFVQFAVETNDAALLCLDTLDPGSDTGAFCASRQAWLTDRLDHDADRPVILFLHHQPAPLGLPMQDEDRMGDGPAFLDLIEGWSNVRHMCIGHVHRPITGVMRGIPFTTMRSVLYQAPPPRPAWAWDGFKPALQAPSLGVVTIDGHDLTIQFDQFCRYEVGVEH